jgi:hypothetical protein
MEQHGFVSDAVDVVDDDGSRSLRDQPFQRRQGVGRNDKRVRARRPNGAEVGFAAPAGPISARTRSANPASVRSFERRPVRSRAETFTSEARRRRQVERQLTSWLAFRRAGLCHARSGIGC